MDTRAADVTDLPRPTGADDVVRASVRALIAYAGLTPTQAAPLIGMNDDTLRRRLHGRGEKQAFTAGELARIADRFRLPVSALFSGQIDFSSVEVTVPQDIGSEDDLSVEVAQAA